MTEQETCYSMDVHPFISTVLWLNSRAFWPPMYDTIALSPVELFLNMHFQKDFQSLIYKTATAITIEKMAGESIICSFIWGVENHCGCFSPDSSPSTIFMKSALKVSNPYGIWKKQILCQVKIFFLVFIYSYYLY